MTKKKQSQYCIFLALEKPKITLENFFNYISTRSLYLLSLWLKNFHSHDKLLKTSNNHHNTKQKSHNNAETIKKKAYEKRNKFGIWTPNSLQILAFLVNRIGISFILPQSHSMLKPPNSINSINIHTHTYITTRLLITKRECEVK